jgi:hypothetical protein
MVSEQKSQGSEEAAKLLHDWHAKIAELMSEELRIEDFEVDGESERVESQNCEVQQRVWFWGVILDSVIGPVVKVVVSDARGVYSR